ncbi:MAG: hypothetical protein KF763_17540 [Cyclobacteriaceae bacterium]|nr:hypothetical protein [Cyclobacteriaceae bacterium]
MRFTQILIWSIVVVACSETEPQSILFQKQRNPVWTGTLTAADPSVIRDGDTLRMYYSSLVVENDLEKLVIASAKSIDGINWMASGNQVNAESIALDAGTGWDKHLEAVSVIAQSNELWMYYCGYPNEAEVEGTIVAKGQIGLAHSPNKYQFERNSIEPLLSLGEENQRDANALFSPTVLKEGDSYYMFYVGYCIEDCTPAYIGILGATSTDGVTWTKLPDTILSGVDAGLEWAEVIKEPALVKGPDGDFYLFITGDHTIGVARSTNILGPYEVYPEPLIKPEFSWEGGDVIAPSVLIESGKIKVWYMGVTTFTGGADFAIGYAEADFPLKW